MVYDLAGGIVAALMVWTPMWMASNAPRPQEPFVHPGIVMPASADGMMQPGATPDASSTTQTPAPQQ